MKELSSDTEIHILDRNGSLQIENNQSVIRGTSGNDTIMNFTASVTVDAGAGNDRVENYASYVSIGGAGDDSIFNSTSHIESITSYVTETKIVQEPVYEQQSYTETVAREELIYSTVQEAYTYYRMEYVTVYRNE